MRLALARFTKTTACLAVCAFVTLIGVYRPASTKNRDCVSCAGAAGLGDQAAADHFKRGLSLAKNAKWAQAESEYREAIRLDPNIADYRAMLADALAVQGKSAAADAQYKQEKKLDRAQPAKAIQKTGPSTGKNQKLASGGGRKATKPARTANKPATINSQEAHSPRPPEDADTAVRSNQSIKPAAQPSRGDGSTVTLGRKPIGDPEDSGPPLKAIEHFEKGMAQAKRGIWAEAESEYRKALAINSEIQDCWHALGKACAAQMKWSKAAAAFRQTILLSDEAPFHADLAEALLRLGDRDAAIAEAKAAIKDGLEEHPVYKELGLIP